MLIYLQRPRCWETYVQSSTLEPSNLQLSKLTRLQIMLSQYVRSVIDWLIKQLDAEISNMQSYLYTDNADKRSTFKSFFSFVFSVGISRTQMDLYCFGYHSCISVYATSDIFLGQHNVPRSLFFTQTVQYGLRKKLDTTGVVWIRWCSWKILTIHQWTLTCLHMSSPWYLDEIRVSFS